MIVRVLLIASSLFAAARVRSAVVDQIIIGRMAERRNRIVCSVVVGGAAAPTREVVLFPEVCWILAFKILKSIILSCFHLTRFSSSLVKAILI